MGEFSGGIRDIEPGKLMEFSHDTNPELLSFRWMMSEEDGTVTGYDAPENHLNLDLQLTTARSDMHVALTEIYEAYDLQTYDLRGWSYDSRKIGKTLRERGLEDTPENIENLVNEFYPDNPEEVTYSLIAYISSGVRNYPEISDAGGQA